MRHPLNFVPQVTLRTKSGDAGVRAPVINLKLQHTNKYYTSVNNTTFIFIYNGVYMSGRHVST